MKLKAIASAAFAVLAAGNVSAGDANLAFDQHFKVKNSAGERIVVNIARNHFDDREKSVGNNDSKRFKYNGLKEEVKKGCGNNCTNVEFTRDFELSVKKKNSSYWSSCSFEIGYYSTKYRSKVKSRYLNSENCKADIVFSGEDGKTLNIEIKGFDI